jgi:hypothetical protein
MVFLRLIKQNEFLFQEIMAGTFFESDRDFGPTGHVPQVAVCQGLHLRIFCPKIPHKLHQS